MSSIGRTALTGSKRSAARVLVTGAGGQLGIELGRLLQGTPAKLATHVDLDVTDRPAVAKVIAEFEPQAVIHAAAMTNVDGCEADPAKAYRINALGAWNVALACRSAGAAMVYVSTNYVFDGSKPEPHLEYDPPRPISAYGSSKLAGELAAARVLGEIYVVRSAWIYSPWKRNFVTALLENAKSQPRLRYVNDQFGSPTRASDLARAILQLIPTGAYGIYHLTSEGSTSWHGWARAILEAAHLSELQIEPIPATEFRRSAAVPQNGVLANTFGRGLGIVLPDWRDALREFVDSHIKEE